MHQHPNKCFIRHTATLGGSTSPVCIGFIKPNQIPSLTLCLNLLRTLN